MQILYRQVLYSLDNAQYLVLPWVLKTLSLKLLTQLLLNKNQREAEVKERVNITSYQYYYYYFEKSLPDQTTHWRLLNTSKYKYELAIHQGKSTEGFFSSVFSKSLATSDNVCNELRFNDFWTQHTFAAKQRRDRFNPVRRTWNPATK